MPNPDFSIPDPFEDSDDSSSAPAEAPEGTPEGLVEALAQLKEAMEGEVRARQDRQEALYGEEDFGNEAQAQTYYADVRAYDEAAYTKANAETDYSAYRYNLQEGYRDDAYSSDGHGYGLTTWTTYNGRWMNSWYSGYNSVEQAIEGVHDNVATFIEAKGITRLEIVPNLSSVNEETCHEVNNLCTQEIRLRGFVNKEKTDDPEHPCLKGQLLARLASNDMKRFLESDESTMGSFVVRFDSSLYETLGIEQAQQHYIVDGIAQALGAQSFPCPYLFTLFHSLDTDRTMAIPGECSNKTSFEASIEFSDSAACARFAYLPRIPNVLKEVVTEITRARGLPLLVEKMPGWLKRVNAFRSVMFINEPAENDIPSAYLMYAVWEREVVETPQHHDAVQCVNKIEEILESVGVTRNEQLFANERSGRVMGINMAASITPVLDLNPDRPSKVEALMRVESTIVDYLTAGGPINKIVRSLEAIKAMLERSIEQEIAKRKEDPDHNTHGLTPEEAARMEELAQEVISVVHYHNRTIAPNPSNPLLVKHVDHPDCPSPSLLSEAKAARVNLSRKTIFSLLNNKAQCNIAPYPIKTRKGVCENTDILALDRQAEAAKADGDDESEPDERVLRAKSLPLFVALGRIEDLLGVVGDLDSVKKALEEAEANAARRAGKKKGEGESEKTGTNCTHHDPFDPDALRSDRSLHQGANRNMTGKDPILDGRGVIVYCND